MVADGRPIGNMFLIKGGGAIHVPIKLCKIKFGFLGKGCGGNRSLASKERFPPYDFYAIYSSFSASVRRIISASSKDLAWLIRVRS